MNDIKKLLYGMQNEKIYIVGFGRNGKNIAKYLKNNQIYYYGFVDKKVVKNVNENIIKYENIDLNGTYIISSPENENEMIDELKKYKVNEKKIVSFCKAWIMESILNELYEYNLKYSKKIKHFKNINKGQSCFIVGNGPSLRIEDLEILHNNGIKTFASNCIYSLYDKTCWRPTYYVASDTSMTNNILLNDLEYALDGIGYMFTSINSRMIEFSNNDKINYLIQVISKNKYTGLPKFSDECEKRVYLSGTVAYQMMQLAVYMGFENIYLIGMDCSYAIERQPDGSYKKNDVLNHNYIIQKYEEDLIDNKKISQCWADVNMQMNGYRSAKKYCDAIGVKIYNATRGGKLEVFERVNFDLLF